MDKLRMYMVTWNVATGHPCEDVHPMLNLEKPTHEKMPDLYIVGLQEVKSQPQNIFMDALFEDPWTIIYKQTLARFNYVKVKTIRLQGILLSVFCLKKHILHLRDIETQYTKTGLGGVWGNKGGVSIRFSIYGCSICIVNCHLTPHDHLLNDRINDYNSIISSQTFQTKETSHIFFHDYVFWLGDLNFRLLELSDLTAEVIDKKIKKSQYTSLLEKDQLKVVMNTGVAFSEFEEQTPTFPPTYKFHINSSNYDLKRRPSWTDRILYKVNAHAYENLTLNIEQITYKSINSYCLSDHKPVLGEFIIKVFSDYYERVVEFEPIPTWYLGEQDSYTATFSLAEDVQPSLWDWVALFKDGFASLDDYLSYIYTSRSLDLSQSNTKSSSNKSTHRRQLKRLVFPEAAVNTPGIYRLLYFNQNSSSVLGMSQPFRIIRRDEGHCTRFAIKS